MVEKVGDPKQSYEDFAAGLPADECRYAVYDFDFMTAENVPKSKIFFIAWYNKPLVSKIIFISVKFNFVISAFEGLQTHQGSETR